jgi:hypothetical protein
LFSDIQNLFLPSNLGSLYDESSEQSIHQNKEYVVVY